jgi:hypothetical protein
MTTTHKNFRHAAILIAITSGLGTTNCRAQSPGPPPPPPPPVPSGFVAPQPPPPPPGRGPRPPAPPPPDVQGSRTTITGMVRNFNYGPGGVDGLILDHGTVVHFPPEYGNQVTALAPAGSSIAASGWLHIGPASDSLFDVDVITNQRSRASVTLAAPAPPPTGPGAAPPPPPPPPGPVGVPPPPPAPPGQARYVPQPRVPFPQAASSPSTVVTGAVRSFNYGPDGQVNGLILSNGTVIYFPPEYADHVTRIIAVSGRVRVTGEQRTSPAGKRLIDAQVITNQQSGSSVTLANLPAQEQ